MGRCSDADRWSGLRPVAVMLLSLRLVVGMRGVGTRLPVPTGVLSRAPRSLRIEVISQLSCLPFTSLARFHDLGVTTQRAPCYRAQPHRASANEGLRTGYEAPIAHRLGPGLLRGVTPAGLAPGQVAGWKPAPSNRDQPSTLGGVRCVGGCGLSYMNQKPLRCNDSGATRGVSSPPGEGGVRGAGEGLRLPRVTQIGGERDRGLQGPWRAMPSMRSVVGGTPGSW